MDPRFSSLLRLFAHSITLGTGLMVLTIWIGRQNGHKRPVEPEIVIAAANVLFVCLGLTAVMILVADNIARAFAVGGAIALLRFRVKMGGKFMSVALLYAVITGMACGVGRLDVAWVLAGSFAFSLGLISRINVRLGGRSMRSDLPISREPQSPAV